MQENNVIHNDLKPDNIFLNDQLIAIIGDFGTTKITENVNTKTEGMGFTIQYSPPEILSDVNR